VLLHEVELSASQHQYVPSSEEFHGVRALLEGQEGAEEYWKAVDDYLKKLYPNHEYNPKQK